jgi:gamma-glutamylcyclotransferase (GGCT)/AIG2-like uncharacterized protein YtfP
MSQLPSALFFYGVLRPDLASGRMAELVALLGPAVPASVKGTLFAVASADGHYPAMVAGPSRVHGTLLRLGPGFSAAHLEELDRFEGTDYARRPVMARGANGSESAADAYLWCRPSDSGLAPIPHGDFARYLAETGATPLPG